MSSDPTAPPQPTLGTRAITVLENGAVTVFRFATPIMHLVGGVFVAYLIFGSILIFVGEWSPPFPFLAVGSDPYFTVLSTLTGCIVCLVTGSLILLAFIDEKNAAQSISTLIAFIGFGFGAGVIRMTYLTTFRLLMALL